MSDLWSCFAAGAFSGAGCALVAAVLVVGPHMRRWRREREMRQWWDRRGRVWMERRFFRG